MKVSARRILSVILALACLMVAAGNCLQNIAWAEPVNLLKNGSFEIYSNAAFEDWGLWKGNHGKTAVTQADGRTEKSAKISVNDNSSIANFYQNITLEENCEYIFSAWIKIENIVRQWETAPGVYLSLSYNNNLPLTKSNAVNYNTDWQKIEFVVDSSVLKGNEESVLFDLVIEYVKGDVYIDDACIEKKEVSAPPQTPETNELLKNNGFEIYSNDAFEDWGLWKGNHGKTAVTQVDGRTGKSAKITVNDNSSIVNFYQDITLEENCEYIFSAWIKIENIVRQWETAPGVYLSLSYNNNLSITKSSAVNYNTDWQKIEFVVDSSVLKGNEESVLFDLVIEYVKGDIYIDDAVIKLKEETTPPENPDPTPPETGEGEEEDNDNPTDEELLKNTGFESYSDNKFSYWEIWRGNQGNTKLEQAEGRTGNAAKVTVDNNNNTVNLYQSIKLDSAKKYIFTAWVKTENISLQWDGANGVFLNLSYNNNLPLVKSSSIKADSDWQELRIVVDGGLLKGDEWGVHFDIAAEYITGSVYIDDVSIEVADGDDIDADAPVTPSEPESGKEDDADSGEILKNKGLEKYENGSFANWTLWKGNKGNTTLEQVDGRTGKAAKITVDNNQNIVNLYQEIKLDPTLEYTFTVWVKTENIGLQWPGAQGVYLNLSCNNNKILMSESVNKDSDWQKLEVVINGAVLQGDEWSVRFDIAAEYITGAVYIDDAQLQVTGKATPIPKADSDELLKNNSFEIYSAGNFANWTAWKGNKGNTKIEQVDGRNGKAAKITVDNNNNIVNLYQEIELDQTKEYTFSVWVKTENIALQWPGAQGVYLNFKHNNSVVLMSKPVNTDSKWQKLEVVVNGGILKGDEWGVSIDIAAEFLTGTIYIDDASVKVTGKGTKVPEEAPDELLKNSSFELYSGYNFARWNLNRGNRGNTLLEQVENGRTGKGAKITVDDNNNIVALYQDITLDPRYEYTFTVWVKLQDIKLQWEGAEGVYLGFGYNNTTPIKSKAIKTDTDNWQKLEVVVGGGDLKGDEWGVMFTITAEFLTGTIYVDDASMKITGDYQPKATTFLENGSFDMADDETVIKDWNAFAEDLFSVLERNTDKAKDGIASASIFNSDDKVVSYWEQRLDKLDTTKQYLLSGYIFSDMVVSDKNGAAVFVEFYDREGHLIRTERSDYVKGEQTDWTEFELKLAFPENCFTMVVKAGLIKAVGTAYFDGFALTEFEETNQTAKEGVFENIYFMGIADEDSIQTQQNSNMPNILIIAIIGISVILIGTGATLLIIFRKKKSIKSETI